MIGSRVQQTCSSIPEKDAETVRNRGGVTRVTVGNVTPIGFGLGVAGIRWNDGGEETKMFDLVRGTVELE